MASSIGVFEGYAFGSSARTPWSHERVESSPWTSCIAVTKSWKLEYVGVQPIRPRNCSISGSAITEVGRSLSETASGLKARTRKRTVTGTQRPLDGT